MLNSSGLHLSHHGTTCLINNIGYTGLPGQYTAKRKA